MVQIGHPGVLTIMENTGNFYDDDREVYTSEGYAQTTTQTENSQTKVSGSRKWANRIFTTFATIGWIIAVILLTDAIFNNGKLITRIMAGQ